MIKLVRHRLQVRDDSFSWHDSGRKKMSGNKIYFRGEIRFDDGWGEGNLKEKERYQRSLPISIWHGQPHGCT